MLTFNPQKALLIFISFLALTPLSSMAYINESTLSDHPPLSERAQRARRSYLRYANSLPEITFQNPDHEWVDMYRPSRASRLTMEIYRPLTHGLDGVIQSTIDRALGEEEAFQGMSTLRALGREAKTFAQTNSLNRMEALCVASCIVSELIFPEENIPHMLSLDLALSFGTGDCKIYAEAMQVLSEQMGIPLQLATSWLHAFNRVTYHGRDYFVDATRYDGMSCNYVPVSFYR